MKIDATGLLVVGGAMVLALVVVHLLKSFGLWVVP
jgi:hypothetical protein